MKANYIIDDFKESSFHVQSFAINFRKNLEDNF